MLGDEWTEAEIREQADRDQQRRWQARDSMIKCLGMDEDAAQEVLVIYDALGSLEPGGGQLQVAKKFWELEKLLRETVDTLGRTVKLVETLSKVTHPREEQDPDG